MHAVNRRRAWPIVGGVAAGLLIVAIAWGALSWLAPTPPLPPPVSPSPSGLDVSPSPSGPDASPSPSVIPTAGPSETPSPDRQPAQIELVFADWIAEDKVIEVSGFTGSVVQSGGTCTLTASGPEGTATVTRQALEDRTVTTCGTLRISGDELVAGKYSVTLTYRSDTHEGTSASVGIVVSK